MATARSALMAARGLRALARNERGAAAVEAAFVLPLLFVLTIGGLEVGRALWYQGSIRHAVMETARYAAVHGFASGAAATTAELETMAANLSDLPGVSPVVTFTPDNRPGSEVSVSISHTYTPMTGVIFGSAGFTLSSATTLTIIR